MAYSFIKIVHCFAAAFAPISMLFRHPVAFACEETALKTLMTWTNQCSVIQSSGRPLSAYYIQGIQGKAELHP